MSRQRRLKIEAGAFFFTLALADRGSDRLDAPVNAWARGASRYCSLRLLSRF
jgi:hypothetical protein